MSVADDPGRTATGYSELGRQVAAGQGWPVDGPPVNWEAYGRACSEAMGKRKPVPTVALWTSPAPPPAIAGKVRRAGAGEPDDDEAPLVPKSIRELIRLRELGVLTKAQARAYLGLRPHWWSR